MYIFAENIETWEVFEVLTIELYQGDVMFVELMDSNGAVTSVDNPEGLKFTVQYDTKGDDDNK